MTLYEEYLDYYIENYSHLSAMIFDSRTISDWQTRGITDVSCFLVARGCAGEKVQVEE